MWCSYLGRYTTPETKPSYYVIILKISFVFSCGLIGCQGTNFISILNVLQTTLVELHFRISKFCLVFFMLGSGVIFGSRVPTLETKLKSGFSKNDRTWLNISTSHSHNLDLLSFSLIFGDTYKLLGVWWSERLRRWSNKPDVVGSIPVTTEFLLISCDSNQVPKWFGTHYNLEIPL